METPALKTGVRRCGKSTLLELMAEHLREQDVEKERILFFKMESMEFDSVREGYHALLRHHINSMGQI